MSYRLRVSLDRGSGNRLTFIWVRTALAGVLLKSGGTRIANADRASVIHHGHKSRAPPEDAAYVCEVLDQLPAA
jgi:hypothetical protein